MASLIIEEMQIVAPVGAAVIETKRKTSVGEPVERLDPSCTASGNAKWCGRCGKRYGGLLKTALQSPRDPAVLLLSVHPK